MIFVKDQCHDTSRYDGLYGVSLKMWRMDIFFRHNCGKSENVVGHRWAGVSQTLF